MQSITWIVYSNYFVVVFTVCGVLSNGKVFAVTDTTMDVTIRFGRIVTEYVCNTILHILLHDDYGCKTRSAGNRVHFVYGKNTFHGS
jgi:hypothetical protein